MTLKLDQQEIVDAISDYVVKNHLFKVEGIIDVEVMFIRDRKSGLISAELTPDEPTDKRKKKDL